MAGGFTWLFHIEAFLLLLSLNFFTFSILLFFFWLFLGVLNVYIDDISKVVLPSFISTRNHVGYTPHCLTEDIGLISAV